MVSAGEAAGTVVTRNASGSDYNLDVLQRRRHHNVSIADDRYDQHLDELKGGGQ